MTDMYLKCLTAYPKYLMDPGNCINTFIVTKLIVRYVKYFNNKFAKIFFFWISLKMKLFQS